jgi:hypothetical protein
MEVQDPKPLPLDINLSCYACESNVAAYLCRYTIDELSVQVCLCRDCMNLDTNTLLKNTIGIASSFLVNGPSPLRDCL